MFQEINYTKLTRSYIITVLIKIKINKVKTATVIEGLMFLIILLLPNKCKIYKT